MDLVDLSLCFLMGFLVATQDETCDERVAGDDGETRVEN